MLSLKSKVTKEPTLDLNLSLFYEQTFSVDESNILDMTHVKEEILKDEA